MKLLLLEHHAGQKHRIHSILHDLGHEASIEIPPNLPTKDGDSTFDAVLLLLSPSPDVTGIAEQCRRLRSFSCCARSRLLALSEEPLAETELQALLDAGIQDYLGPPIEAEQLQQRLLILERQAQEFAQLQRKFDYQGRKQQRRQRTEKALRTSMEDALKKSWDYLEILNDSLEDAIVTLTMPERTIEYGNRAVEHILGYTLDECQGENFRMFFPDDRGEREFSLFVHEASKKQQPSLHVEHILQRASGEQFTAEITTTFLYEQHTLTRTVSSIRDITERKNMEKALEDERASLTRKVQERTGELQLANKELARASQHKDRFLANMSHELRTPLNAILGYAKILQNGKSLTQLQQDGLRTIRKSGDHLLHLITDILDLSKIEAGHLELQLKELCFPDFLSHIADMIRIRAEEKAIRFSYTHDPELPQGILADEKRLREVLINLLDNAVKFTHQGEVLLRITYREKNEHFVWLLFEIEDSGPGIPPEHLTDIFLPFQQGGNHAYSTEGTGLGLTICRQLVQLMGGELEVRSVTDAGSVFSFALEFPVLEHVTPRPSTQERNIISYLGETRRIMLVDDKAENREILLHTLAPLGFDISEAESGLDCLAKLSESPIDLILLDLRMADLDGFETTQRIRSLPNGEAYKIIAVSASVFEETRQKSLAAGCDAFLPKPIDDRELFSSVQTVLDLEWNYPQQAQESQENPAQETDFPPLTATEIEELRTFARHGNMTRILQALEQLEARGPEYHPLAGTLRHYSMSFQMNKILETIDALEIYDEARDTCIDFSD